MNGPELLEHAADVVNRRRQEYGEPVDVFEAIAKRWSSVFRTEVSAAQVVIALLDVKLARLSSNPKHLDSIVDIAGYAAMLAELAPDA
jgi:translation initiation factor 2 alpha subunit (eIF-2alpha)